MNKVYSCLYLGECTNACVAWQMLRQAQHASRASVVFRDTCCVLLIFHDGCLLLWNCLARQIKASRPSLDRLLKVHGTINWIGQYLADENAENKLIYPHGNLSSRWSTAPLTWTSEAWTLRWSRMTEKGMGSSRSRREGAYNSLTKPMARFFFSDRCIFRSPFLLWKKGSSGPWARFSKVPRTFRARKAIRKSTSCLFCKTGLFVCCKGSKNKNNCKVLCLETLPFWRYKENYVTWNTPEKFRDLRETGPMTQWCQISFLWLVMALSRESHSREIPSENKSVYENIVQLHASTNRLLVKAERRTCQEHLFLGRWKVRPMKHDRANASLLTNFIIPNLPPFAQIYSSYQIKINSNMLGVFFNASCVATIFSVSCASKVRRHLLSFKCHSIDEILNKIRKWIYD